ncbi:MAG: hypothetical protein MHM6MM_004018 [Cercozoa sp. M6MM]
MPNYISKTEALATLSAMFSEMDPSVIQMVLESNGNQMETTVESLLAMSAPNQQQQQQQQGQQQQRQQQQLQDEHECKTSEPRNLWDPLPSSFLRLPGQMEDQLAADAELARMLQDQLFMRQLQSRPQLLRGALQAPQRQRQPPQQQQQEQQPPQQQHRRPDRFESDEPAPQVTRQSTASDGGFSKKWNAMSQSARRRLALVAARMRGHKSSSAGQQTDGLDFNYDYENLNSGSPHEVEMEDFGFDASPQQSQQHGGEQRHHAQRRRLDDDF